LWPSCSPPRLKKQTKNVSWATTDTDTTAEATTAERVARAAKVEYTTHHHHHNQFTPTVTRYATPDKAKARARAVKANLVHANLSVRSKGATTS